MRTRIAQKTTTGITAGLFEAAMARYAEADCREAVLNKQAGEEVAELMDRYKDELDSLRLVKYAAFEVMQSYCLENKEALFGKRRSIGTVHGVAGFRLGTPRLKTMKGRNWNDVVAELKTKLPGYVRNVEEPAKDLLLADRHKETVAPVLVELGVQVVQDELFYIDIKKAA